MLDKWDYLWNKLNTIVFEKVTDGEMDECHGEGILDACMGTSDHQDLMEEAEKYGIYLELPR